MITQGSVLQTVDPRYGSWLTLVGMLSELNVITVGQTTHKFSHIATTLSAHKPKPHWIPLAVVSLAVEYLEIVPLPRKK